MGSLVPTIGDLVEDKFKLSLQILPVIHQRRNLNFKHTNYGPRLVLDDKKKRPFPPKISKWELEIIITKRESSQNKVIKLTTIIYKYILILCATLL